MVARAVLTKDRKTLAGKGGATRKNYFGMSRLASHTTRLFRPDPSAWLSLQQQFQRTARKASSELGSHHSKRIALGCPGSASNSAESQRDRSAASSSEAARVSLKSPSLPIGRPECGSEGFVAIGGHYVVGPPVLADLVVFGLSSVLTKCIHRIDSRRSDRR